MYSCTYSNNWYQITLNPEGAKFKVIRFDKTGNFNLRQMSVDMLAQQDLPMALRDEKTTDIATID